MGIHRSALRRRRRTDAAEQKEINRVRKIRETARRHARMMEKVKAGSLPYSPTVMSWLSEQLNKPSSRIVQEDLKALGSQ